MKKLFWVVLCLFLLGSCNNDQSEKLAFDLSGIDPFWQIMDSLSLDREPSDSLWDSMFSTPGYKTLTDIEFPVDWIKSYMRGGVMPSQQAIYQDWVAKNFWDTIFCVHMRHVYEHRDELLEFSKLINDASFINSAKDLMTDYWEDAEPPNGTPPISFLFFSKDARGYDPVIIDLLFALDKHKKGGFLELIAHEFHHYYRTKVLSFEYPSENSPDFKVVHTINQIHMEGIADMIDKSTSLANPYYASTNAVYHQNLVKTPKDMMRLDSLLAAYAQSADTNLIAIAQWISETARNSGHPMGYLMATSLWKYESKESVYQEIGNPFAFFRRYNDCAKKSASDLPVFSDLAIEALRKLEVKYALKRITN